MNDLNAALHHYDLAMEQEPKEVAMRAKRGFLLNRMEKYDKALIDYNFCINKEPQNSDFFIERADVYQKKGMVEVAKEDWKRAVLLGSQNPSVYYNLGIYHYRIQDYKLAKSYFTQATRRAPKVQQYQAMLSHLEQLMNDG